MFILILNVYTALAWMSPDRCKPNASKRTKRDTGVRARREAEMTNNITEIAADQNRELKQLYKGSKFFGVPIKGSYRGCDGCNYTIYVPTTASSIHMPHACCHLFVAKRDCRVSCRTLCQQQKLIRLRKDTIGM